MPSLVVHLALAGLLAAALLHEEFGARAVLVVFAATTIPDLDVFAGFVIAGGHRSVLHNIWIPLLGASVLYYDTRLRESSAVGDRWGQWGITVAWVSVLAYAVAGVGFDLLYGVNPLYPVYDQFYKLTGKLVYSTQRGIVQTFVDLGGSPGLGSAQEVGHVSSGVDPSQGSEPETVDRVFPVARAGWELYLTLTSAVVLAIRLFENRRRS
jgi:membrane-bound metal-dependent hydrolase YbcI (DUF457 family)